MSQIVGATHPGNRDHNEDCFVADTEMGLGLVADGMGGYACGEVASELVRETVVDAIVHNEGLQEAIARAHGAVREAATNDHQKRGMGSTVIAFRLRGQDYELAWVGDSRAYLWDGQAATLHQITRDHSYVETLLASGAISQEEAINHPNRNLITQAVGVAGDDGLAIDWVQGRLGPSQQLLICSDGLVDEVLDDDIAAILAAAETLARAADQLIARAVANGGSDNVTVVIAACEDADGPARAPAIVRSTQPRPGADGETGGAGATTADGALPTAPFSVDMTPVDTTGAVDTAGAPQSHPTGGGKLRRYLQQAPLLAVGLGLIVLVSLAVALW